jgi:DNA-binding transcriptional ArsR family regulator
MPADPLSVTFAALADATRRAILARLASGACSVTELAEPFEMSMPAVSKHLRVLERAGLVARGREAQWRPCHLEAAPLKTVSEWAEQYRHVWEGRLDRLDSYLQQLQVAAARERAAAQPARRPRDGAATRPASRMAVVTPKGRPAAARESAAKPATKRTYARHTKRRS